MLGLASIASAQITTGSITGTVRDGQGGVIPGATVILTSDTQGTKSSPVVTDTNGDFVFVNLRADTYTIEVSMPSFNTLKRSGLQVSPGERVAIGPLVLEVGGTTEVVDVKAEAPMVQSTSAERSFTIATDAVTNLPIAGRAFTQLAALAPGVTGTSRIGDRPSTGGGDTNIQMDGVSTMDTGSNRAIIDLNVESIAEVKVLVSSYQAEFGRSSGLQITAVTKSGTNRFRGSVYDVERNSDWNANSKTNILNGDPKNVLRQRDWGYSIGGPVGKPGGNNKLFFFYTQEFEPRTGGNDVVRYRLPTALERQGDFSKSTDNLGNLYPVRQEPGGRRHLLGDQPAACFADGGVLGRIPASQLYQTGLNILKMYPMPNIENVPAGQPYNFEITRPSESILSTQPAMRFDYQATQAFRVSFKYSGFSQREQVQKGSIPGWNDTRMVSPNVSLIATTANYSLTPTLFLEGTFGRSKAHQGGCFGVGGGGGPQFCNAFPVGDNANLNNIGSAGCRSSFPKRARSTSATSSTTSSTAAARRSGTARACCCRRASAWGNRVSNNTPNYAPPNIGFPSQNVASSMDVSISLTKVWGRHTIKTGFYNQYSNKQQVQGGAAGGPSLNFQQDAVGTNPCDTSFGFSNAAIGCFSSYSQGSKGVEGEYIYYNTEGYVQDNWRVNSPPDARLRRPAGAPDPAVRRARPGLELLRRAVEPLRGAGAVRRGLRQRRVSVHRHQPAGDESADRPVPRSEQHAGDRHDRAQQREPDQRTGAGRPGDPALDLSAAHAGPGAAVWHGLRPDRTPAARAARRRWTVFRPPVRQRRVRAGPEPAGEKERDAPLRSAADARRGGLATEAPSSLSVYEYDSPLPSSWQWNGGPDGAAVEHRGDVSYVGQHGFNIVEGINLNAVDFGTAFLPENQDRDAGADDAGRDLALDRSDARVPRVQRDHAERQPRLDHASFAPAVVQPPVP